MLIYWIWLATRAGVSDWERQELLAYFASPEDIYFAGEERLRQAVALRPEALASLLEQSLEEAEAILRTCAIEKIHILTWNDTQYPTALRNIADPPVVLYYKGKLPMFDEEPMIGVVGTRKASLYGLQAARQLGSEIVTHGGIVVSGMAEGVDAMATEGALRADGFAVGVLGCGVDRVYPMCNRQLFRQMEQRGCLLSEYPPGTPPNRWNFPRRNRIISGLSCGVLVVEAPKKSGALITAGQALAQGRDVFVVPGNIGVDSCAGSNGLLKDGATAIDSGWDILSAYIYRFPNRIHRENASDEKGSDKKAVDNAIVQPYSDLDSTADDLNDAEQKILSALSAGEQLVDTLIAETRIPSGAFLAALTMLEVKGYAVTRPGGWVAPGKYH